MFTFPIKAAAGLWLFFRERANLQTAWLHGFTSPGISGNIDNMLPASCQTTRLQPPQTASSCDLKVETDILIIGAGPAGLALGFELGRRGLRFLILEKGSVGMSWARMPRNMRLASPWKANSLPGTPQHLYPANCEISREEYLAYLADYARRWELPVRTKTTVKSIERSASGGFLVH